MFVRTVPKPERLGTATAYHTGIEEIGPMIPQQTRTIFLDQLRTFVTVLVVILHGSMTYMVYAPAWWYVVDSQQSLFFTMLVLLIDVPIMPTMFFIAGYFALPSLVRRGAMEFRREKFLRIGLPWLFGLLLLAPPIAYMTYFSRGAPISLFEFWSSQFWSVAFQQSVYWFLGVLLFLFLGLSLAYQFGGAETLQKRQVRLPDWRFFVTFLVVVGSAKLLLNQFFAVDSWFNNLYIVVFQPLRVPLYLGYFWLGLHAYRRGWFTPDGYQPRRDHWIGWWIGTATLYLVHRLYILPADLEPRLAVQLLHAILLNAFCLSSLIFGLALFRTAARADHPIWRRLSAHAYGIYYVHPLILYPLAYLMLPFTLPLPLKAPLVIFTAILLSWAVSRFVLTRVVGLRRVFG
jgi:glucan biosynthesis protein C